MVSEVHVAKFFYITENPYDLTIIAWGRAATPNWSNARLELRRYVVPPADCIQDFDFVAEPPGGIQNQVMPPIVAIFTEKQDVRSYWGEGVPLKGVRIHAGNGSVEAAAEQISLGGGGSAI